MKWEGEVRSSTSTWTETMGRSAPVHGVATLAVTLPRRRASFLKAKLVASGPARLHCRPAEPRRSVAELTSSACVAYT